MPQLKNLGEFELIRCLTRGFKPRHGVLVGPGDDCAVLRWRRGQYLLWTTDILMEGVHFRADTPGYQIGWKALAVSLSDIAAMAGKPEYALVFVGLPPEKTVAFAQDIYQGIGDLARRFHLQVVGGDTNAFSNLVVGTTVLGTAEKKYLTLRAGARVGDIICVSGPLGKGKETHLTFLPAVYLARRIKRCFAATAMIDISDGLWSDFGHIAEQSGVGGRIFLDAVPTVPGVSKKEALVSGEEFELLFTVSSVFKEKVCRAGFFVVGEVTTKESGVVALDSSGRIYQPKVGGYDHFQNSGCRLKK